MAHIHGPNGMKIEIETVADMDPLPGQKIATKKKKAVIAPNVVKAGRTNYPNNHDDYVFITAWGRSLGSGAYFVNCEINAAIAEQAPFDAVYRDAEGRWVLIGHCHEDTRKKITRIVADVLRARHAGHCPPSL